MMTSSITAENIISALMNSSLKPQLASVPACPLGPLLPRWPRGPRLQQSVSEQLNSKSRTVFSFFRESKSFINANSICGSNSLNNSEHTSSVLQNNKNINNDIIFFINHPFFE